MSLSSGYTGDPTIQFVDKRYQISSGHTEREREKCPVQVVGEPNPVKKRETKPSGDGGFVIVRIPGVSPDGFSLTRKLR